MYKCACVSVPKLSIINRYLLKQDFFFLKSHRKILTHISSAREIVFEDKHSCSKQRNEMSSIHKREINFKKEEENSMQNIMTRFRHRNFCLSNSDSHRLFLCLSKFSFFFFRVFIFSSFTTEYKQIHTQIPYYLVNLSFPLFVLCVNNK